MSIIGQHWRKSRVGVKIVDNFDNWSGYYNAVQDLPTPEKIVYIIVKLNQSVTNGGFAEFYEHGLGIFAPEIAYILTEVGAKLSGDIVTKTLSAVNPSGLIDNAYKELVYNMELNEEQQASLYAQDIAYDQLQDVENLETLLGDFLQRGVQ